MYSWEEFQVLPRAPVNTCLQGLFLVLPVGIEPTTYGLRVRSPVKILKIDQESPKYAPSSVQERSLLRPSLDW